MNLRDLTARIFFEADLKPLEHIEHKLESINSRLEILAAGEILRGIFELAERFSTVGENIETAAISAGLSIEAFQKLAFAAGQNAVSQEELSGALAKLARNLSEARDGSKSAIDAFAAVGISPEQVAGFHDAGEAMAALSDRIAQIDDPIKRAAATMSLLGRGSTKMIKFLSHGSAEMRELSGEAEAMGTVLSTEQVENLAHLEDAMSALGLVFKTAGAALAANFAPAIIWLTQAIGKFYAANRKAISVNMEKWAYDITYALGYAYGWFEKITQIVLDFAAAHPTLVRRVGEFALALGAVSIALSVAMFALGPFTKGLELLHGLLGLVGKTGGISFGMVAQVANVARVAVGRLVAGLGLLIVQTFPALGEALFALGVAIEATPIGWVITGLAALTVAAQALWQVFHGKDFWSETWLGQALTALKGLGSGLMKKLGFDPAELENIKPQAMLKVDESSLPVFGGYSGDAMLGGVERIRRGFDGAQRVAATPPDLGKLSPATQELINTGGKQANTFNANVTVNAPAGTDPKQVATLTKAAIQEQFATMMRDTHRALQTPVRG
jgi:hypothetical protein